MMYREIGSAGREGRNPAGPSPLHRETTEGMDMGKESAIELPSRERVNEAGKTQ
jgi:hypothetical protein